MNNGDDSWYFYNTATKNAGRTEFQRKWGNRKLEDDWRRRNKSSFNFNDFGTGNQDEAGEEGAIAENDSVPAADAAELEKENDPHFPEYYLKQIPSTDEDKQTANDVIQEGRTIIWVLSSRINWRTSMRQKPSLSRFSAVIPTIYTVWIHITTCI